MHFLITKRNTVAGFPAGLTGQLSLMTEPVSGIASLCRRWLTC